MRTLLCLILWGLWAVPVHGANPQLIRIRTADAAYEGKSLRHDARTCWLVERDGHLHEIRLSDIEEVTKVDDRFRPLSVTELRDQLRRSVGRDTEVAAQGRYVVSAPRGQASRFAELLHETSNEFTRFLSRRGFPLATPEFPLVVRIFPNRTDFAEYATALEMTVPATLRGFYHRRTNQIALYLDEPGATTTVRTGIDSSLPMSTAASQQVLDTLVHEAIHQLAFNTGLHSRMGDTPKWVVEGLAMLMEEESSRDDSRRSNAAGRINRQRYSRFMAYRQSGRPAKSLAAMIESEEVFEASQLDGYAEAWALSFFLFETRPSEYADYLERLAARDPTVASSAEERRADFEAEFGSDLDWLEVQYLRFVDELDAD
jgi:hypothetical protein